MRDKLKPHVHQVKGARMRAFYDLMGGALYRLDPGEGSIAEVREQLLEAGLIFETGGVVPVKWKMRLGEDLIHLRELQVRLDGSREDTC